MFWKELRNDSRLFKVVAYKVLRAVERIHKRGLVHRDIKPENVLLSHIRVHSNRIDYAALRVNIVIR